MTENVATWTFEMDGAEHTAPDAITGCCGSFCSPCPKCGSPMHLQPVYGGQYRRCENPNCNYET